MIVRLLLAAAVAAAPMATPAQAQRAPEWEFCDGRDRGTLDEHIRNCTALIESGRESPANRAAAYNNRGFSWARKGDYDRAITDNNVVIRLKPDYAPGYYNRGLARQAKGDKAGGEADIATARRLQPGIGQ